MLGVDGAKGYTPALKLLGKLGFGRPRMDAVHVVEVGYALPGLPGTHAIWNVIRAAEDQGRKVLDVAVQEARALGLDPEPVLLHGRSASKLIEISEGVGAGLIVVGSERKGRWASLFFGSVTRELSVNAKLSFLVGKGDVADSEGANVVFAMDHSDYAHACAKRLLNWKPAGLKRITFVTGYSTDISALDFAIQDVGVSAHELEDALTRLLIEKSEALCQLYRNAGVEASHRVEDGDPRDVIANAMDSTNADLLVLGARGHSLTERITLGSISMHFVVNSPHSTLVIRS